MTNPTPHGQVPEALIDLIDTYAETRHRYGRIYNAKTEAARKAVIEALSGVQALSAAPAGFVPVAAFDRLHAHAESLAARLLAASPTPPAEQQASATEVALVGAYARLPDFDSGDEPIWEAVFKWKAANPGSDASKKAMAVEGAIIKSLRDFADRTHALRQAVIAPELQAEARRRYDAAIDEAMRERDDAEDFIDALLDEVLGHERPEWSNLYGRADALNDVQERIAALHKPAVDKAWGQFQSAMAAPQPAPATQQAGDVVAYLDVGAGGYLDLGSELSEDALQQLPKGRHALVIAGTYGIDGYVAAPQQEAQQSLTPETGNSVSAKGAAITSESGKPPAEQQARWVERWHGSGGKEFWEGWSILNAANREMIAHLGPDVDPDAVRGIVAAHNEALCGECAGTGGRWCPACAGATPPAEQQAAPKAAPGVGNSVFDHQTAADFLSGKTVSDEAVRKFVATSRWAHDERAALSAKLLAMHGVLTSREAEIALLKKALLEAEAAPQQEAQDATVAAFEAVRKKLCTLPRYSFVLDDDGLVRRAPDRTGNWIEFDEAHALFDPVSVDAAIAAQGSTP